MEPCDAVRVTLVSVMQPGNTSEYRTCSCDQFRRQYCTQLVCSWAKTRIPCYCEGAEPRPVTFTKYEFRAHCEIGDPGREVENTIRKLRSRGNFRFTHSLGLRTWP